MDLPAAPGDTGDLALGSIFTEAKTAHAKVTHISAGPAADHTTVIFTHLEFRYALLFDYQ